MRRVTCSKISVWLLAVATKSAMVWSVHSAGRSWTLLLELWYTRTKESYSLVFQTTSHPSLVEKKYSLWLQEFLNPAKKVAKGQPKPWVLLSLLTNVLKRKKFGRNPTSPQHLKERTLRCEKKSRKEFSAPFRL